MSRSDLSGLSRLWAQTVQTGGDAFMLRRLAFVLTTTALAVLAAAAPGWAHVTIRSERVISAVGSNGPDRGRCVHASSTRVRLDHHRLGRSRGGGARLGACHDPI